MLGVGWPGFQPLVPRLDVPELRPLDVQRVPAMDEAADRDVAHGEMIAGDIELAGELLVEPRPHLARVGRALLDRGHVALFGRRADEAPENLPHRLGDG